MKPTGIEWIAYESLVVGGEALPPAPLLNVVLSSGERRVTHLGIIDSGSDVSCLPPALADELGLPLDGPSREVRVLGGIAAVRSAYCDLRIATSFGLLNFRGVEFAVPLAGERTGLVVLGQKPLFNEVEVRFQGWLRRFGLQRRIGNLNFVPATRGRDPSAPQAPA